MYFPDHVSCCYLITIKGSDKFYHDIQHFKIHIVIKQNLFGFTGLTGGKHEIVLITR